MKNILIVEGATEKRLVPELMEQRGVPWPDNERPVEILDFGGFDNIIKEKELETVLKSSELLALGIVFDADDASTVTSKRWESIRARCVSIGIDVPASPVPEGLILSSRDIRVGLWMMPNNSNSGMLETFLTHIIPAEGGDLYELARKVVAEAHGKGAPYKATHLDKALIHTWLAWQDPPGLQLHQAVKFRVLDSTSASADPFVVWFKGLFGLEG